MTNLTDVDKDAMRRAIAITRRSEPGRDQQITAMLFDRPFERVGRFAAFSCQMDSLHLQPWETPPVWIRGDIEAALHAPNDARRVRDAARLLQRMLALGISRYEPSPMKAIEQAEAQRP
jgi:hypothetical protein